jgi:hypothetical protein
MRSLKMPLFAAIGCALFFGASMQANAGSVVVLSDSGTGPLTIAGATGGLDVSFGSGTTISIVNQTSVPALPVTLSPFDFLGTASMLTATATKTITDGTDTVTMNLSLSATVTSFLGSDFLLVTGTVTNVAESNPSGGTYNWLYLNQASFVVAQTGVGIAALINNPGGTSILSTGSFTQTASIPEPSSVVLMGLGVLGLVGFRSLRSRSN